jgi:hypothetical protein
VRTADKREAREGGEGRSLLLLGVRERAPLLADLGCNFLDRDAGVSSLNLITALSLKDKVGTEGALGLLAGGFFCNTFGLWRRLGDSMMRKT